MNYSIFSLSDTYKIINILFVLLTFLRHAFKKLLIVKLTNNCVKIMYFQCNLMSENIALYVLKSMKY